MERKKKNTRTDENPKPAETAIKVENVSKAFRILASRSGGPYEKISSLRGPL